MNSSKAGAYADIQMQVDSYVGDILDTLEQAGVADDTIVILTGDNAAGEQSTSWGGEGGSNGPWRGGLRTPGMIPDGVVTDEIMSDLDWSRRLPAWRVSKAGCRRTGQ